MIVSGQASSDRFIIWTLRRTGGTNLAVHLGVDYKYHEPFNSDRVFGGVQNAYRRDGDQQAASEAIERIASMGVCFKHCVETVPWELSEKIARHSTKMGYKHIFLFRREPQGRVLSLHFAEVFDIWGRKQKEERADPEIEGKVQSTHLPVADLVGKEMRDREVLKRVFDFLVDLGSTPAIAVFEDIYNSFDQAVSIGIFHRLCGFVNSKKSPTEAEVRRVLFHGAQGTRDKYSLFPNYQDFCAEIGGIGPFRMSPTKPADGIDMLSVPKTAIVNLFDIRESWRADLLRVEGVAAQSGKETFCMIQCDGREIETINGLRSDRFSELHPQLMADHARFVALDIPVSSIDRVGLVVR